MAKKTAKKVKIICPALRELIDSFETRSEAIKALGVGRNSLYSILRRERAMGWNMAVRISKHKNSKHPPEVYFLEARCKRKDSGTRRRKAA